MSKRVLVIDDSPTIRKVVTSILERRGYETRAAADGQQGLDALATDERFDLVLLDFVMPRMNGYQFCRAVRAHDRLRSLPVVLMSAKSDRIRDQFAEQTGAVDAITKPFDAHALVTVIENAIRRVELGTARIAEGLDGNEARPLLAGATTDELQRAAREVSEISGILAKLVFPALADAPMDEGALTASLTSRVTLHALRDLRQALRDADLGDRGAVILSGRLTTLPIGAVLQMLQIERQTGLLEISRPARPRTEESEVRAWQSMAQAKPLPAGSELFVTWRNGLVDLVQSRGTGDEFRLGRFFVEEDLVTPAEIDSLLGRRDSERSPGPSSSAPRRLLGDMLVADRRVSEDQLRSALIRQASELLYELLRWQKGRFEFRHQSPSPEADRAKLALPIASIVMEGFRRVDEWRLVEASLGSFESVLQCEPVSPERGVERLSRQEKRVLDTVDGERTVREIIAASHLSSFDACRILAQLLDSRVVHRRAAR
jgi:CheY-like chemotaxis protein